MKHDELMCTGCIARRLERERQRQAELKRLAFELVASPITNGNVAERRKLIQREAPRWDPDNALRKHVGDVDAFDYPDVLERAGVS